VIVSLTVFRFCQKGLPPDSEFVEMSRAIGDGTYMRRDVLNGRDRVESILTVRNAM